MDTVTVEISRDQVSGTFQQTAVATSCAGSECHLISVVVWNWGGEGLKTVLKIEFPRTCGMEI